MKIYLLAFVVLLATIAATQKCQQVGTSSLATLASCKVMSPAPRLQWGINVTLQTDYDWQAAADVQYAYMTLDDQPIQETCYQGQTQKGKYSKGNTIMIEHLCFGFNPDFSKGSKLYLLIFSSQESSASQVIYMTFNGAG